MGQNPFLADEIDVWHHPGEVNLLTCLQLPSILVPKLLYVFCAPFGGGGGVKLAQEKL